MKMYVYRKNKKRSNNNWTVSNKPKENHTKKVIVCCPTWKEAMAVALSLTNKKPVSITTLNFIH